MGCSGGVHLCVLVCACAQMRKRERTSSPIFAVVQLHDLEGHGVMCSSSDSRFIVKQTQGFCSEQRRCAFLSFGTFLPAGLLPAAPPVRPPPLRSPPPLSPPTPSEGPSPSSSSFPLGAIIGVAAAVVVLLLLAVAAAVVFMRRRRSSPGGKEAAKREHLAASMRPHCHNPVMQICKLPFHEFSDHCRCGCTC